MKKLLACAALAAAIVSTTAHAEETGSILLGNPITREAGGITETVGACDPASPTQGLDGAWYPVTAGQEISIELTGGATGLEDLDAWFYDSGCGYIDSDAMATGETSESGTAPAGAAWMVIDLYTGAQATYAYA